MSGRDIKQAMEKHVDELMAIPGVVGVAIGELEDGAPAILVLVVELSEALQRRLPRRLDGYPVKIVESGEIRPLDTGGA